MIVGGIPMTVGGSLMTVGGTVSHSQLEGN